MKNEFILEIGTEELPAKFILSIENKLTEIFSSILNSYNIKYQNIETFITPNRILVLINNLSEEQNVKTIEIQGPPVNIFYDEKGNITETGNRFLKSKKITLSEIKVKETQKGKYIFIVQKVKPLKTEVLIPEIVKKFISSIPLPKSMRWDNSELIFLRPIRWIGISYKNKPIKFKIGNIITSNSSSGNKFISPKKFKIKSINLFKKELKKNYVIISPNERKNFILKQINKILTKNLKIMEDEDLLNEVSNLVEYPFILLCEFEEKFLNLPEELICTAIKHHQKAFPIYENEKLTNKFIVIINNIPNEIIKKGEERVLKSRLNDAKFFFEQDRKYGRLIDFKEKLKNILFLTDMCSMYEKSLRIENISLKIIENLNLSEENKQKILKCAQICKCDLVTNVVYEFPELQGICGRIYALLDNEDKEVALGIEEHYKPKNIDDVLPKSLPGIFVSIADKIDSIVGCFIKDLKPTGSYDPYQLRRFSLGIINIIIENKLQIRLDNLIEFAFENYKNQNLVNSEKKEDIKKEVLEFFKNRFKTILTEKDILPDEIDSILSVEFYDIYDSYLRVLHLHNYRKDENFKKLLIALKRMANILKEIKIEGEPDESLFKENAEYEIFNHHKKMKESLKNAYNNKDYLLYYKILSGYKNIVDKFFDEVLVMCEDEKLRFNRLKLLNWIVSDFKIIDFSKIVIQ